MTDYVGHKVPNGRLPRAPYIINEPGDPGDLLQLDADGQQSYVDVDTAVFPSGGSDGEVLESDGSSGVQWSAFYKHMVGLAVDTSGVAPVVVPFDHPAVLYDATIYLDTPTVALWTLDLFGGAEVHEYVQYLTTPPLLAAATTVAAGAANIAMPALTIALPTSVQIDIQVRQTPGVLWQYAVDVIARNAAGDVEGIYVRGTATHVAAEAVGIEVGGPMVCAALTAHVVGY